MGSSNGYLALIWKNVGVEEIVLFKGSTRRIYFVIFLLLLFKIETVFN